MKSQDIVLLLKLVSLTQQERGRGAGLNSQWQDWEDAEDDAPDPSQRHFTASPYASWGDWANPDQGEGADIASAELLVRQQQIAASLDDEVFDPDPHPRRGSNDLHTAQYGVRALAASTGISKSQVSLALQRCFDVGLAKPDRKTGVPRANTKALGELIVYGVRYVFPTKTGEVTRGIATSLGAPVLKGQIMTAGELVPVWPDARGNTKGQAVQALTASVPQAVRKDAQLYALLALTDAIRIGQPRERNYAADKLTALLKEPA
jgi:hypothetical protein